MPYWRLSGFYFFFFASLGALLPYWGVYLKSLGYNELAIGNVMATIMATKIISPNVWGWIADHTGRRMAVVRFGSLAAALAFVGVFFTHEYAWLLLVMVVFSFFWNAALPQFEAVTLNHLGPRIERYSGIRVWGSIGFIVAVWGLGSLMEGKGVQLLPWILLALFLAIWLNSLLVPEDRGGQPPEDHVPLKKILANPRVVGLLLICFLMQASHGPYYTFYSIYMHSFDYSLSLIGGLWALGVIAEVLIFVLMTRLVGRFNLRSLLLSSLLLATLRWSLMALYPQNLPIMLFSQLLHAATFGVYHAVTIKFIHHYFSGRHQGKGQALYSSLSFGAGGALGSFYSGYVYDSYGPMPMFFIAAGISLLGFVLALRFVPSIRLSIS